MKTLVLAVALAIALVGVAAPAHASFINYSTREINVKMVYFGPTTHASANLTYVYGKTNPDAKGKLIKLAADEGKENVLFFDFLPLSLGEIRGFKTRLHLYTVVSGKDYSKSRALILKGVDGIVFIADADPASAKQNASNLAELKQILAKDGYDFAKVPVVVQLVGTEKPGAVPTAELVKSLGVGDRPVYEAVPATGVGVFDSLKAITKLVLMELKKAPAAKPTPTSAAPAK